MKKLLTRSVAAAWVFLLCAIAFEPFSHAQQTLGSLNGTVTDVSGAVLADATVTATSNQTGLTRSTKVQKSGYWELLDLPVGTYRVTVSRQGFSTVDYPSITVQEMRAATVNASLKPGQVSESVTANANPLMNATDTTNGYTLDKAQIEATPLATVANFPDFLEGRVHSGSLLLGDPQRYYRSNDFGGYAQDKRRICTAAWAW